MQEPPSRKTDVLAVLCTFPTEAVAVRVGRELVAAKLAACVNIVPTLRSIYEWQGEICDEAETLAVVKTSTERFEEMRDRLVAAHPYDCPEVIALPVTRGHHPYLEWVTTSVGSQ